MLASSTVTASTVTPVALAPRPFLKWAGGKRRLLAQYENYFPQRIGRYYEPFLGGGAVFFHLYPRLTTATIADANPELINVYDCLKNQVDQVIAQLEQHRQHHSEDHYYQVRNQSKTSLTPAQRAARLIYLNRTCYNGLYRENAQGRFNVPMGRYKRPTICNEDLLRAVARSLNQVEVRLAPFQESSASAQPGDFVYFDPPYHPLSATSNFTAYSRYPFGAEQQIALRDVFADLANRGVQVMLSNSDCQFIRQLYADFELHTITACRSINSKAQRRGKITEVLVTTNLSPRLQQMT
jgi:DNA adenine methylase